MSKPAWKVALEEKEQREKERELELKRQKEEKLRNLKSELGPSDHHQEEIVVPELGLTDERSRLTAEEERISKTFETRGVKLQPETKKPVEKKVEKKTEVPAQLRDLSESATNTVLKNQWLAQTEDKDSVSVVRVVRQVRPTEDMINIFEGKRNELERFYPGRPLKTIWAYFASNKERINTILKEGFPNKLEDHNVTFYTDPVESLPFASDKVLLLCRLACGKEGDDYTTKGNKYYIKCGYQVMPTWHLELK